MSRRVYNVTSDTWLNQGSPDANNGGTDDVSFAWDTDKTPRASRGLLTFDLSDETAGAIGDARVRVKTSNVSGALAPTVSVYLLSEDYVELEATWNSSETATPWATAMANGGAIGPIVAGIVTQVTWPEASGDDIWHSVDVTAHAKSAAGGNCHLMFATEGDLTNYTSDTALDTAYHIKSRNWDDPIEQHWFSQLIIRDTFRKPGPGGIVRSGGDREVWNRT